MSSSKIYKDGSSSAFQPLHFGEFGEDGSGGGTVIRAEGSFRVESVAPASQAPAEIPASPGIEEQLEEAFARGRKEGVESMESRFGEALRAFTAALDEIGRLRETILKGSTDDMLRLVMAITEQVIPCEISTNPEIIHHTIQKALQAAVASDEYHIKIHPDDFAVVTEKKPLLMASISGLKNITLEPESSIGRGGCLVESELGEVDATIATQLDEIWQKTLLLSGSA